MAEKQIGVISHYFDNLEVGIIDLTAALKVGDTIHIKGAHDDFTQTVDSMQLEHETIEKAKKGDSVGVKVSEMVHKKDKVYKVT